MTFTFNAPVTDLQVNSFLNFMQSINNKNQNLRDHSIKQTNPDRG